MIANLRRNAVVAQLDEEILGVVNRIAAGPNQHVLQVVVREVKVATQSYSWRLSHEFLQMGPRSVQVLAIIGIAVVGVGGGNDVLDSIFRRQTAHLASYFPGLGTVINFGKDMRVDVDHD